jgi:hypothetical protein
VTVEAVDLKDLVQFADNLDFAAPDALSKVASFAGLVMTNVGSAALVQRVGILERGMARQFEAICAVIRKLTRHALQTPTPPSRSGESVTDTVLR